MQKYARKLGLSNKVTFLGHVAGTEKLSLLKSVWAVVSTSHHENFGFSIAEALSVGTPVLLTRNVATYVQVVDGNAGVVFNHTVKDCANAIQSFIEAPVHMRAKYGANAHICFEKNFRIIAPARKLLETVQRLLKGKKG